MYDRKDSEMLNREHPKIYLLSTIVVVLLVLLFSAAVITLAWNWIVVGLLSVPAIQFYQSFVGVTLLWVINNIRLAYLNKTTSQVTSRSE